MHAGSDHLEGSMNLNTVPKGDIALGCEVARKYSSPERHKQPVSSVILLESNATCSERLNKCYLLHLQQKR